MPNKLILLSLAVCMIFCLSACGTAETNSSPTNTPSESQTEAPQHTDEITSSKIENNQVSSNPETESENDTAGEPKPNNQSKSAGAANQPTHTHSYSDATCTSPKKCSCGVTAGSALGHSYSAADCISPKTCTRCGQTEGSALGHNYVNNKCSRCGKVDPDSLPVGLNNLFLIDSYMYKYKSGTFTDSFGNTYNGAHYYTDLYQSGNGKEPHSEFNLNGKYKLFVGSIVASTKTDADWTYYINIYVDGILKFSKNGFSKTSGKVDFKLDVKNAATLRISAGLEQTVGDFNQEIAIVNAQLEK